ncbi:MAG: hypothetical protein ACLP3C_23290 [Mycobacterium sp.]
MDRSEVVTLLRSRAKINSDIAGIIVLVAHTRLCLR